MKNNGTVFRRILSLFLAIVMCITMQDMAVFAADTSESGGEVSVEEIQKAEKAIARGLRQGRYYIPLEGYQMTGTELSTALLSMAWRYPQYFVSGLRFNSNPNTGMVTGVDVGYSVGDANRDEQQKEMEQAASEIVNTINSSPRELKDYEKAWLVCQWLAQKCEYAPDYNPKGGVKLSSFEWEDRTGYNALVKKAATSEGYSAAYVYIMKHLLGIPCLVVLNDKGNHVWNMVKINGKYYHVDVTWSRNEREPSAPLGDYFLLTDDEVKAADKTYHSSWSGPYDMENADGPSYKERNPLWRVLDSDNKIDRGSGIAYYEGGWYFAAYNNIYRVADLLDYDNSKMQRVWQTDTSTAQWSGMNPCIWTYFYVDHDCLYFNGKQRIYRLNLADKNEEERTIQPGNHLNLAEDITFQTVNSTEWEMWQLLDVDNQMEKKDSTKFISKFNVEKDENNEQKITFDVMRYPQEPLKPRRPYYYLRIQLLGDIDVTGELGIGKELTADVRTSSSLKPMYHTTAQVYYRWYRDDFVICRNTTGVYTPTEEDIGKTLRVVVTYDNYTRELSKEIGVIPKLTPTQPDSLPSSITGQEGGDLSTVPLPDGYEWKNPDTPLDGTGKLKFPALYCPDSDKYEAIEVTLTVDVKGCSHTWDKGKTTIWPRCHAPGEKTYTCTECGETKKEVIPEKGTEDHWNAGKVIKAATCGATGILERECINCGEKKTEVIPVQGNHKWKKKGTVTKAPTPTSKGIYTTKCSVCDTPQTYNLLYAKTGNFSSNITYVNVRSEASTASSDTIVGKLSKNAVIYAFENELLNAEWTKIYFEYGTSRTAYIMSKYVVMGEDEEPTDKELKIGSKVKGQKGTYKVTGKDTLEFTKATGSTTVTIVKTVKVDGKSYKVTSVAAKALKNNKKVKKVVIGSNITKIGAEAFSGCKNLKTISILSSKLKSVGKNAIKNINKKATISCPKKKKAAYKKLFKSRTGYKKTMKIK